MLTLYHCKDARSLRPLWLLEELGIDFQLVGLNFPPRAHHPEYLEVNPLGTVPCLIDGDVRMTESVAMLTYLVERYGVGEQKSLLINSSEADYGVYLDWIYRSDATLTFPQALVLRYRFFEKGRGLEAVAEDYERWFYSRLKIVSMALQDGRAYLVGDRFTIADIAVGYSLYLAKATGLTAKLVGPIEEYLERLVDRSGFINALNKQKTQSGLPLR